MKSSLSVAEKWLWLGVAALGGAGLYALVPVVGRTPQLQALGVGQMLFDVALVVHVDLSVLVWSLAMLGLGISLTLPRLGARTPVWPQAAVIAAIVATALIALSPFGTWLPVKSNYIPVLHNGVFFLGLALLAASAALLLLPLVLLGLSGARLKQANGIDLLWLMAGVAGLLGLGAYLASGYLLAPEPELQPRYEHLFWAGGHIMQFCYTLTAMAAWLMVLEAMGRPLPSRRWTLVAGLWTLAGVFASLWAFAQFGFGEAAFTQHFTQMMIEIGGVGPSLLCVLLLRQWLRPSQGRRPVTAYGLSLAVSLLLFFAGGALGLMISGQNVTIPAHYHGMIVGITQALMGLAYVVLPRFGYASVARTRLARWQPVVYGAGQFMHIGGLAYCGGYGVLRKTAGGFAQLAPDIKIALGIFGLGGLLAITGGILFVVVMLRASQRREEATACV